MGLLYLQLVGRECCTCSRWGRGYGYCTYSRWEGIAVFAAGRIAVLPVGEKGLEYIVLIVGGKEVGYTVLRVGGKGLLYLQLVREWDFCICSKWGREWGYCFYSGWEGIWIAVLAAGGGDGVGLPTNRKTRNSIEICNLHIN